VERELNIVSRFCRQRQAQCDWFTNVGGGFRCRELQGGDLTSTLSHVSTSEATLFMSHSEQDHHQHAAAQLLFGIGGWHVVLWHPVSRKLLEASF
jgi:hypothetical protein